MLAPPIASKTRLKLLTRFFLNQNLSGYLQGFFKEFEENTNSIRVDLNCLQEAELLVSKTKDRHKLYSVNSSHPLTSDLTSIVREVSGADTVIDRLAENFPMLK